MDQDEWQKMSPATREKYLEIIRAMPLGRRLQIAIEHSQYVRDLIRAGIRMRNPGITEEGVRRKLIRMTLPPDLVAKVYSWAEDVEGDISA